MAGPRSNHMSMTITTDHLLLDDQGPTITARGYEISWIWNATDPRPGTGRELIIERLSDGRSWNWRRGLGRWTVTARGGDIVDGWQRASA
jgi:hypothetical protein